MRADTPMILVSLKNDLRKNTTVVEKMHENSLRLVTQLEGELVAVDIGAKRYIECSSLSGEGVHNAFEAATRAALLPPRKDVYSCCVVL